MESDNQPEPPEDRKSLLKSLVLDALNTAISSPDLSISAAQAVADKIGDAADTLDVDQIAEIVKIALETAGEGLGDAAGVAGAILEGLSNLDLNV